MTNQRICDACKLVILRGQDYCKLQWVKHNNKQVEYLGIGHLCINCLPIKIEKEKVEK
jgi:hypothetical protein